MLCSQTSLAGRPQAEVLSLAQSPVTARASGIRTSCSLQMSVWFENVATRARVNVDPLLEVSKFPDPPNMGSADV